MKIGIFGGSFNPIHTGHAILANHIVQNTGIDRLWLMVAPQNPLKPGCDPSYDTHRLHMAQLVASQSAGVEVSDFEFSLPYPSYTINTLDALSRRYPEHQFQLVVGADNWALFDKWREPERIINEYGLLIYPRRGFEVVIDDAIKDKVRLVDAPLVEISSSCIRRLIASGGNISFLVPHSVRDYIKSHNLYT